MRVVFMGTPAFAVPTLERLVASPYEVVAVYTRRDQASGRSRLPVPSPVKTVALAHGLALEQPAGLRREAAVEALRALAPDLLVVAAYGLILPAALLEVPRWGCLNVHPSLLPRGRGPAPVAGTLLAGDEMAGVTIMLMDPGTDTGPILAQRREPIAPDDNTGTLTARLAGAGADLLLATLPDWVAGRLTPRPQDESQATYTRLLSKEDGVLDWSQPAVAIWRQVRAMQPWPGSYTFWRGKRLLVLAAQPMPGPAAGEPGLVLAQAPAGAPSPLLVQTGDGWLALLQVQIEGRRPAAAAEFLRGQAAIRGERLLRS